MNITFKSIRTEAYKSILIGLILGSLIGLALGIYLISTEYSSLVFYDIGQRVAAVIFLTVTLGLLGGGLVGIVGVITGIVLVQMNQPTGLVTHRFYLIVGLIIAIVTHQLLKAIFLHIRDITTSPSIIYIAGLIGISIFVTILLFILTLKKGRFSREKIRSKMLLISILCIWSFAFYLSSGKLSVNRPPLPDNEINGGTNTIERLTAIDSRPERPNVILISIDTLRSDHLSCYGYNRPTSPNIDIQARQGAMFVNSHAQAPWTLPSHATMMTSLYPSSHGVNFIDNIRFGGYYVDVLDQRHTTLAELLKANGYKTLALTSVVWLSHRFNMGQGFDRVDMNQEKHTAEAILKKARKWVSKSHDKPFFLFLHFFDVHDYKSPANFENRYQFSEYNGPLKGHPSIVMSNSLETVSKADISYIINLYDGAISYVDFQLGLFFEWIKKIDKYDNTLIIITSDHGEEFWEHGGTGHGFTLYEEQLKVPLIIKPPRNNKIQQNKPSSMVGVIDVTPTVLDYTSISPQPNFEGISLRPLIEKRNRLSRKLFAEASYFFNTMSVSDGSYKFINQQLLPPALFEPRLLLSNIRSLYKFKDNELFNLKTDNLEKENLAKRNKKLETEMGELLVQHASSVRLNNTKEMDKKSVDQLKSLGYIN